jgi:hypothetical protein
LKKEELKIAFFSAQYLSDIVAIGEYNKDRGIGSKVSWDAFPVIEEMSFYEKKYELEVDA